MSRIATLSRPLLRGLMVMGLVGSFAGLAFGKLGGGWMFFPALGVLTGALILNAVLAPHAARYLRCVVSECGWEGNLRDLEYRNGQCPRCEGRHFRYGVRLGLTGSRVEYNPLANTRTTTETWNVSLKVGTHAQIETERPSLWTKDGWLSE